MRSAPAADDIEQHDGTDEERITLMYVRTYPEELPVLAELLPQIATPVTLVNGRHDPLFRPPTSSFSTSDCPTAAS